MDDNLIFDPAWERAIAPQDRQAIRKLHEQHPIKAGEIRFVPIRAALNHKRALLAMVLVQNGTNDTFTCEKVDLVYSEKDRGTIAVNRFNLPNVRVPSQASMPWTFVFTDPTLQEKRPLLKSWSLQRSV